MILRSLVMIAYKDIGSKTTAWNNTANSLNTLKILLSCVLTVHKFEYLA